MSVRIGFSAGILLAGLLASGMAAAQKADAPAPESTRLVMNEALVLVDYQVIRVVGDEPIDLMGFHLVNKVADGVYLGAGLFAPLVKGVYGGFTAYDINAHLQRRLTGRLFATAGLSLGGGAGGRSPEHAQVLAGSGGFYKAYVGLGYDLGDFAVGLNVSKMKFLRSSIDGTQANAFVQVPFNYLTGPFGGRAQGLSPAEAGEAAAASTERMLTLVLDNFKQLSPQGSYKGSFNTADLQFAQFFAHDTYWYAGLGVGYKGLPLYNHVMGGLGQRVPVSPRFNLYGQLGIGSGGYSPDKIDTDAGLVVYPRIIGEYALTKDLGLSLSAGYLAAPKGSSKNLSFGIGLTQHLGVRSGAAGAADTATGASLQGFRVSLFQETESSVRFIGADRGSLNLIGIQAEALLNERWYIPLQASVAYTTYLGYPGYGELLTGIGVQTLGGSRERLQVFGELMAGPNVHGLAVKAGAGLRYGLTDRAALRATVGHIEARSKAGNRFTANSLSFGFDYMFSLPTW